MENTQLKPAKHITALEIAEKVGMTAEYKDALINEELKITFNNFINSEVIDINNSINNSINNEKG